MLSKKLSANELEYIEKRSLQQNSFSKMKLYDLKDLFDSELEKEKKKLFLELIKKYEDHDIYFVRKEVVIKTNKDGEFNRFNFNISVDSEKKVVWIKPKFWFKE